jgi:Tfp pilus assembly protein PilN
MIKINLAKRLTTKSSGSGGSGLDGLLGKVDLDQLKDLPIKKAAIPLVAAFIASYGSDYYRESMVESLDVVVRKLTEESQKLQTEGQKFESYTAMKKIIDEDEITLKTKLDTINTLLDGRKLPARTLLTFLDTIPEEVWLTEVDINPNAISVKGSAFDFSQISDFMKNLNESSLFSEVSLTKSEQAKGKTEAYANFELGIRKK